MEDDRRKNAKPTDSLPARRPSNARIDSSRESKPFSRHSHAIPTSLPICKFFLKGSCNRGASCSYLHPSGDLSALTSSTLATVPSESKLGKSFSQAHTPFGSGDSQRSVSPAAPLTRKPHAFDKQASESWGLPGPTIDPTDTVNQGGSLSSPVFTLPEQPVSLAPAWLGRRRASKSSGLTAAVPSVPTQEIPPSSSASSLGSATSSRSSQLNWMPVTHQVGEPTLSHVPAIPNDSITVRGPNNTSWTSAHTQSTQSSTNSTSTSRSANTTSTYSSSTSRDSYTSRNSSNSSFSSSASSSHSGSRHSGSTPAPRISKRMNTSTALHQSPNHASSQTDLSLLGGSMSNLHRGAKKFHDKLSMMRWIQNFTGPGCDPTSVLLQRADLEELLLQPSLPFSVISELMKIFAHPDFREQGHTDRVLQVVAESPLIRNPKNLKAYLIKLSGAPAPATYAYQENLSNVLDVIAAIMERYPQFIEILGLDLLQISSAKIAASYPKSIAEAAQMVIRRGKEMLGSPASSMLPSSSAASLAFSSGHAGPMPDSLYRLSRQLSLDEPSTDDSDDSRSDGSFSSDSDSSDSDDSSAGDFRRLPLFPSIGEIMADPNDLSRRLTRNTTQGKYESLTHYLDTHFRLLREDAITSIREGIKSWREDAHKTTAASTNKPSEVSFYHSVRLTGICPTSSGIVYRLSFQLDPAAASRRKGSETVDNIDWNHSQRLLYGSLLCLSHDGFQTLVWATVSNRDTALLSLSKEIDVKFADDSHVAIDPAQSYVMVESTSTYFEAYRHVLSALKMTSVHTFPFLDYLVHCKTSLDPPSYLRNGSSVYNMRNVFGSDAPDFDILSSWPTLPTSMDDSQLEAVKHALSNELSVIQGPPGTGKTFIGLKVIRALLDNRGARGLGANGPILIVCFTNHALDQFLEGIMQFEPNVVRIGMRSKSELLKERNLKKLVYEMNLHTNEHTKARKQMLTQLKDLQEQIENRFIDLCKATLSSSDIFTAVSNDYQDEDDDPLISSLFGKSIGLDDAAEAVVIENWLGCPPAEVIRQQSVTVPSLQRSSTQFEAEFPPLTTESASSAPITPALDSSSASQFTLDAEFEQLDEDQDEDWDDRREDSFDPLSFSLKMTKLIPESILRSDSSESKERESLPSSIMNCINAWKLPRQDRRQLYLYWLSRFRTRVVTPDLVDMCRQYEHLCQQKQVVDQDAQIQLLMSSAVIGLTTTGVAKFQKLIRAVGPPIVVVEEAAEVLEAHIVTALTPSTKQLILIGDHEQLRPTTAVHRLAVKFGLDVSLFERLINNGFPVVSLARQRRMRPEMTTLLKSIYPHLSDHPDVLTRPNVKGVASNVYFIDHSKLEGSEEQGSSKHNPFEAAFLARLGAHLIHQGYHESQITFLTAYSGQVKLLRQELRTRNLPGVYVTSVDNYQGQEADIICLSLVRSNPRGTIGFLNTSNRICVALSRAREGLFVMGNASQLEASQNATWRFVLSQLKLQTSLGPKITICCPNHPEKQVSVSSVDEFDLHSPDGGCDLPCLELLSCGHPCPKRCHPFPHSQITCFRPCERIFPDCGHRCTKRCFQDCGLCEAPVQRTLHCGHELSLSCSDDLPPCQQQVTLTLPCSHTLTTLCMHANPSPSSHRAPRILECPYCTNTTHNL